ncbi:hypothetical protein GCM10029976_054240 [Kribbella albertanoniae]
MDIRPAHVPPQTGLGSAGIVREGIWGGSTPRIGRGSSPNRFGEGDSGDPFGADSPNVRTTGDRLSDLSDVNQEPWLTSEQPETGSPIFRTLWRDRVAPQIQRGNRLDGYPLK